MDLTNDSSTLSHSSFLFQMIPLVVGVSEAPSQGNIPYSSYSLLSYPVCLLQSTSQISELLSVT